MRPVSTKVMVLLCVSIVVLMSGVGILLSNNGEVAEMKDISSPIAAITAEEWDRLSQRTFFFGHQSVGENISEGILEVLKNNPRIKLNLKKGVDPELAGAGVFLHGRVGENARPDSKIGGFVNVISDGLGEKDVVAFMKFCYIDINRNTDVKALFSAYRENIDMLKSKYPDSTFVHFTAPLNAVDQSMLRGTLKKVLGRGQFGDNISRNEYNRLLKEGYEGIDPIFDVAYYESISSITGEMSIDRNFSGKTFLSLSEDNTQDGGHLNEQGSIWVAENLLAFLAKLEK